MMKKIFNLSLMALSIISFTACSGEEDDIFDASAAERLNNASALYSARLTAQPNGWAMQYYPTYDNEAPNGKGYLLLTRFNRDMTVNVSGYEWPEWYEEQTGSAGSSETEWKCRYKNEYREDTSPWEVITDNGPVLTFNSYNTSLHYFSDPDFRPTGTGFGGDYEFIVVEAPEDASYMMLKGKKRGTYNLLTPIEPGVDYAEYMADVKAFQSKIFPTNAPTYNVLHLGDSIFKMEGAQEGLPNIYPYDGDAVVDERFNPFIMTRRGTDYYLRFRDKKQLTTGETVQDFRYNKLKDVFESVENAQYFISGDTISRFFIHAIKTNKTWLLTRSASMSDDVKQLYDKAYSDMRARNYTLSNVAFSVDPSGVPSFSVRYSANQKNSNALFNLTIKQKGEKVTMTMLPPSENLQKLLTMFPSLSTFIEYFCQEFTGKPVTTGFDLNNIKLENSKNSGSWATFSLR